MSERSAETPPRQRTTVEIVECAQRLSQELAALPTPADRSALNAVTSAFAGDVSALRRTLRLAASGSGGHAERGGGYREKLERLEGVLGAFLDDEASRWRAADLATLFGWTARLLYAGSEPTSASEVADRGGKKRSGRPGGGRHRPSGGRRSLEPTPSDRPPAQTNMRGGLGGKSLAALEQLLKPKPESEGD